MTTTQEDMLKGDFDLCVVQYTHLDGEKQRDDWRIGRARKPLSWTNQTSLFFNFFNTLWLHRSQFFPLNMFYHSISYILSSCQSWCVWLSPKTLFVVDQPLFFVLRPLMCKSRSSIWSPGPVLWRRSVWRPADSKCEFNQGPCTYEKLNTFTQFQLSNLNLFESTMQGFCCQDGLHSSGQFWLYCPYHQPVCQCYRG